MKTRFYLFIISLFIFQANAQIKWTNPLDIKYPVIQNQGFGEEISQTYTRLPQRAKGVIRDAVWNLSENSSGLAIYFYTNAPQLYIRYKVKGPLNMPHMPTTGVSGVDLYRVNSDGDAHFCFGNYSFGDTIRYSFDHLEKDIHHKRGAEYRLYLPLYNSVEWMEIGIPENAELKFVQATTEKPIVLYGTSIAQGACASRPAMAWGNILQRKLDYPLINLGFSGNGRLEPEVLNLINDIDAKLYILDCMPNLTNLSEDEISQKVIQAVLQIRSKHSVPILLIDHAGNSNGETDSTSYNRYIKTNQAQRIAYEQLMANHIKDLYYLSHDELDFPKDGWVDYVHPSDFGMQQQARVVEEKVREILHMPIGSITTTQPVTQRREPDLYEWKERHEAFLEHVRKKSPKAVILGNSITHYWSGEPEHPQKNGPKSWDKYMRKAGFQNLGCGWDRIENVLWRVYHGELDDYEAEKVVLMIGTNNMGLNSDAEIVDGLRFLLSAISQRQSKAQIKVIGILPRRGNEKWVREINKSIRQMTEAGGYTFTDVGDAFLTSDGTIDEALFIGDGLHPNEKGYQRIAPQIAD